MNTTIYMNTNNPLLKLAIRDGVPLPPGFDPNDWEVVRVTSDSAIPGEIGRKVRAVGHYMWTTGMRFTESA